MTSSVGRNSLIMASGTAASRITGQARTILLAAAIGTTGMAANAYQAGSMIPQVIFTLVSGGIFNAVLVPQIVRTLKEKDAEERLNRLITFAVVLLLSVTVLMAAATPLLTRLYTTNGTPDAMALTNAFTLWCMPQIFFYGLYTVIGQILAAHNHFGMYAWSSVGANVVSCLGFATFILLFGKANQQPPSFWTTDKIALTAGAWTLGVAFQALILFLPLRRIGLRYRPIWGIRGVGLRAMGPVAAWSLGIVVVDQIATIINTRIAWSAPERASQLSGLSQFEVAGNASFQNAYTIYLLPYSLIAVSVATAIFPKISQAIADANLDEARADLSRSLRQVGLLMCFFTVIFLVMPTPLTITLLPSITTHEALLISRSVIALSVSLPLAGAYLIIQRTFYAFEDGRHPFIFVVLQSAIQLVVLLGGVLVLHPSHWVILVSASFSVGYAGAFPVLVRMIRARFGGHFDGRRISLSYLKTLGASAAAICMGWLLRGPVYALVGSNLDAPGGSMTWLQAVMTCVVLTIASTSVYCVVLWATRSEELIAFVGMAASKIPLHRTASPHTSQSSTGALAEGTRRDTTPPSTEAIPTDRMSDTVQPPTNTLHQGIGTPMKPQLGDVVLGRYTLVSVLRDTPGLHAWCANDRLLSRDCQLFIVNDGTVSQQVDDLASFLALSRSRRFTPMLQLEHRDGLVIIVSQMDAGMSLGDYLASPSGDALSFTAMRTILGESSEAVRELLEGNAIHSSVGTDTIRITMRGVELADTPVSPLLADTSQAPAGMRGERLAARQLASVLYAMLTHSPSSTSTVFDSAKLGEDTPEEFRTICARTLIDPADSQSELAPIVTLAELTALLGEWPPLNTLKYPDIELPGIDGSCSIESAPIIEVQQHRLIEFTEGLVTTAPAAKPRLVTGSSMNGVAQAPQNEAPATAGVATPTTNAADTAGEAPIAFPPATHHRDIGGNDAPGATAATPVVPSSPTPKRSIIDSLTAAASAQWQRLSSRFRRATSGAGESSRTGGSTRSTVGPQDEPAFRDIAAEEMANILAPSEPGIGGPLFPGFDARSGSQPAEATVQTNRPTLELHIPLDDVDDTVPLTPDDGDSSSTRPVNTQATAELPVPLPHVSSLRETPSDAVSQRTVPPDAPPSFEPSADAHRQTIFPASLGTPASRSSSQQEPAAPEGVLPPSFKPQSEPHGIHAASAQPNADITEDDIADQPLLGKATTKVVAIVAVTVVVAVALLLAWHGLAGGSTQATQGSSNAWPSLNNVPFGQETPSASASQSQHASSSASSGATTDGTQSSPTATIITADKTAGKVPEPATPPNSTPYNIDKQEFLTNPAGHSGLAYYVHLSQPESVYRLQITIRSSGGKGYMYANTSNDPMTGEQVAEFTFADSGTTDVKFTKTVTAQDFLLWVPADSLPGNQLYIDSVKLY